MSYLHEAVIGIFAWNGCQFIELKEVEFEHLEQNGTLSKEGLEVTLNYVLCVQDDPSFLTFDIGLGNVSSYVVEEAARLCKRLTDEFEKRKKMYQRD